MSNINTQAVVKDLDKAMDLRKQALALLQQAQAIDGLKPFTANHTHRFGETTYIIWSEQTPDEDGAASVVAAKFEPELEETLFIQEGITLQQMTGVDPATRPAVDSIDE